MTPEQYMDTYGNLKPPEVKWVDPSRIIPPHKPDEPKKFRELVRRIKKYGWQGRPLLVERLPSNRPWFETMQGWTGSHRTAAAKKAGLVQVPVVFVDISKFIENGIRRSKLKEGGSFWASPDLITLGYIDLIEVLNQIGEKEASQFLQWEFDEGW